MYGEGVFWEDAINDLYPGAVDAAIEESGLDVVAVKPSDAESISKAEGAVFKVIAVTKPEVSLKDYKGLKAVKEVKEVTDEEVDAELNRRRESNARTISVEDRPAEMGDEVVIDFDGSVDGEKFAGGQASMFHLTLGSNQFIPGFEEQVVGHSIGEEFDINVTFPEDYHAEELKGKASVFKINLHEINKKELPELDDEFVKDISEFDTMDELKADIRSKLQASNEQAAESKYESDLMDALVANMEADIPEEMYEGKMEEMLRDYAYRLQSQGLTLDMYKQFTGMDDEGLKASFRPQAESQVKVRLALDKVVALENIEVTDEDMEEEFKKLSAAYGMEVDQIKQMVPVEEFKKDVAVQKAIDVIKAAAVAE